MEIFANLRCFVMKKPGEFFFSIFYIKFDKLRQQGSRAWKKSKIENIGPAFIPESRVH
jgi:hypothetical protein